MMSGPENDNHKGSAQVGDEITRASLALLYEVGREVASELDLRTVLHRLLFLSMKYVGATSGSIIALDDSGQPTESAFLIHGQTHDHTALQLRVTYDSGMAGWVARNKQSVLVQDTSKDERWLQRPDDAVERTGPKSAVSVPILASEKLVGVITLVHPEPNLFMPDHLDLVEAIADQAGTAIRHAQLFESLQAAHQQYRELFEDSIDPILMTDWQGIILEANRQAVSTIGLDSEDLHAVSISSLHDVDWQKVGRDFENLSSEEPVSYESVLHTRREHEIPIQVYARSIKYEGEPHLQWILRDITERKDLDNLREDLIAMVYHDLRSPLSNVVSSLEVLSSILQSGEDDTVGALLGIALRSTDRIQRLTSSLLDINSLEAGQAVGDRKPVSPYTLVDDALDAVLPVVNNNSLELEIELPSGLPDVYADEDMIRRVLINLLENAIKFTPIKSKIYLGAELNHDYVEMCVKDSGPGISPEDQERIFEKFARLRAKDGPKGLGLGLAYCRLAVVGHGGRIWVESESGSGSSFKFSIPASEIGT
jgi:PAS domain S-box-containing protein